MEYVGNILYDEKLLFGNDRFVIYGAGMYGRMVLDYLEQNGRKSSVVCFCDSAAALEGAVVGGVPVRRTDAVFRDCPDAHYLVSGTCYKEMYQILRGAGIGKIHILMM